MRTVEQRARYAARQRQRRAENPEHIRAIGRRAQTKRKTEQPAAVRSYNKQYGRKRRGLPAPTRPEPKRCELCNGLPNGQAPGLRLDHDHVTGAFRGWLCDKCNRGLGLLGDTVYDLLSAVDYLVNAL